MRKTSAEQKVQLGLGINALVTDSESVSVENHAPPGSAGTNLVIVAHVAPNLIWNGGPGGVLKLPSSAVDSWDSSTDWLNT